MTDEQYLTVCARAQHDGDFRACLLQTPGAALQQLGIAWPAALELRVVENSATQRHLILPAPPTTGPLSDDDCAAISGGVLDLAIVAGVVGLVVVGAALGATVGYNLGVHVPAAR
jgi:hypothetical protein